MIVPNQRKTLTVWFRLVTRRLRPQKVRRDRSRDLGYTLDTIVIQPLRDLEYRLRNPNRPIVKVWLQHGQLRASISL